MLRKLLAVVAVLALSVTGVALAAKPKAKKDSGTAWVGVTHQEGKDNIVAGDIKDKLLGRGAIVYRVAIRAGDKPGTLHLQAKKIVLYTSKGSLVGSGTGDQVINSDGSVGGVENGKFNLTKGTARLKGHTYKGTFTGTYKDGVYTFHYKGTLR